MYFDTTVLPVHFAADSAVTQPGSGVTVSCSASWPPTDRLRPFPACIYSCKFKVNTYMNFSISVAMAYIATPSLS